MNNNKEVMKKVFSTLKWYNIVDVTNLYYKLEMIIQKNIYLFVELLHFH